RNAECSRARSRNSVMLHEVLRENFRRFETRRLLVRAPNPPAMLFEIIDDAERERIIRPYHGEIRPNALRKIEQLGNLLSANRNALHGRAGFLHTLQSNARIAGRTP